MRNKIALILLAYSSLCCGNETDGIIFIGELEWTKLTPGVPDFKTIDGEIFTSNSCGLSETEFEVKEVLFGPEIDSITIRVTMGEWCNPPYPVFPSPMLISARMTEEGWVGGIWEPVRVDPRGRTFIAPMYDGILFGCSTEDWQTPIEYQVPYEGRELRRVRRDYLINEGHLKEEGEDLLLHNVIYIDRVAEMAQSSHCLYSAVSE